MNNNNLYKILRFFPQDTRFLKSLLCLVLISSFTQFNLIAQPSCLLENMGMTRMAGDLDNQGVGDSTTDNDDRDDFISFTNFGNTAVNISGWQLFVDERGLSTPVYTFPASTIVAPNEQVTVIADWNEGPSLPENWFDANYSNLTGFFEETHQNITFAILRNPSTGNYISIHNFNNSPSPTLNSGTLICDYDFTPQIGGDYDECEQLIWNANTNSYEGTTDCHRLPGFDSSDQPSCLLDNVGMSKMYGDSDGQMIGDASNDDEDNDDFISFANFGSTNVDISGWQLFVDEKGTSSPVFTFPSSTILAPLEEVTVVSDWNAGPALPNNWFDANFASGEGMFEETTNRVAYAILLNPSTGEYITIDHLSSFPTLNFGTRVCSYDFTFFVPTDFEGCQMIYWDAAAGTYKDTDDCDLPFLPGSSPDSDGDGIASDLDPNDGAPCIPMQSPGYTGYNGTNPVWQASDCDGDGVLNGQEATDGTDPYDINDFLDADGDGVADTGTAPDANPTAPCIPVQNPGYTGYDASNSIWQAADCDDDGTSNGQEVIDGTDPYFVDCAAGTVAPLIIRN